MMATDLMVPVKWRRGEAKMSRGLGDGELVGVSTEHEACYKFGDMLLWPPRVAFSSAWRIHGGCGCVWTDAVSFFDGFICA